MVNVRALMRRFDPCSLFPDGGLNTGEKKGSYIDFLDRKTEAIDVHRLLDYSTPLLARVEGELLMYPQLNGKDLEFPMTTYSLVVTDPDAPTSAILCRDRNAKLLHDYPTLLRTLHPEEAVVVYGILSENRAPDTRTFHLLDIFAISPEDGTILTPPPMHFTDQVVECYIAQYF